MAVGWYRNLALCSLLLLAGCSKVAADCDDAKTVQSASKIAEEQITQILGLASLFSEKKVTADITLDQFREYKKYDEDLDKRYCEASSLTKIHNLGDVLQLGLVIKGVEPGELEAGIRRNIKYSVQLTSDGTNVVAIEK
jgi:hypothetical protein